MGNKRTGFIDALRMYGERTIFGINLTGTDQHYDEVSTVQNYLLGSRMLENGKVFYYARAGGTLVPDFGVKNPTVQHISFAAVAAAAALATTVVITVGIGDGLLANGAIAANELVGGHIVLYPVGVTQHMVRRIVANTATIAGGGAMTITLDRPLSRLLGAGSNGEAMASEYFAVVNDLSNSTAVVGVAMMAATVGQFCWLQTWGPCWLSPTARVGAPALNNNRQVVFTTAGGIEIHDPANPIFEYAQHAGFVLATGPAGAQGAPFFMLQLRP